MVVLSVVVGASVVVVVVAIDVRLTPTLNPRTVHCLGVVKGRGEVVVSMITPPFLQIGPRFMTGVSGACVVVVVVVEEVRTLKTGAGCFGKGRRTRNRLVVVGGSVVVVVVVVVGGVVVDVVVLGVVVLFVVGICVVVLLVVVFLGVIGVVK